MSFSDDYRVFRLGEPILYSSSFEYREVFKGLPPRAIEDTRAIIQVTLDVGLRAEGIAPQIKHWVHLWWYEGRWEPSRQVLCASLRSLLASESTTLAVPDALESGFKDDMFRCARCVEEMCYISASMNPIAFRAVKSMSESVRIRIRDPKNVLIEHFRRHDFYTDLDRSCEHILSILFNLEA